VDNGRGEQTSRPSLATKDSIHSQDHFLRMHNITIPPRTLGVRLGNHEMLPITVCDVVNQLYKVSSQIWSLLRADRNTNRAAYNLIMSAKF